MSRHNFLPQHDYSSFAMSAMGGSIPVMSMEPQAVIDRMSAMSDSIFNFLDLSLEPDPPLPDGTSGLPTLDDESHLAGPDEQISTSTSDGADGTLPTEPQAARGSSGTPAMSDFTKKKNWPAILMAEMRDVIQVLDTNGRIMYLSDSVASITGHTAEDLKGTLLKDLVHPDDVHLLESELNESIASGSPLRVFYRFRKKDGSYMMFEATGHAHIAKPKFCLTATNQSAFCQAVIMSSRPYPSSTSHRIDSFLDHTMENERLRKRITELRGEEEADVESLRQDSRSDYCPSEYTMSSTGTAVAGMAPGPPSVASNSNLTLTRENIEASGYTTVTIDEKIARFTANSHAAEVERLTGIRWPPADRDNNGGYSPGMVKGDQGIEIPADRDPRTADKKKKLKATADEYMCTDCGTLDSPEWRKGPMGPKTLCNACGLRWAKKEKKVRVGISKGDQAGMG